MGDGVRYAESIVLVDGAGPILVAHATHVCHAEGAAGLVRLWANVHPNQHYLQKCIISNNNPFRPFQLIKKLNLKSQHMSFHICETENIE